MRKAKKFNVFRSLVPATVLALVVVASGCSDKDEYQYREQQREQQLFKIKAVSGTYQGSLKSARDGSLIGDMTLSVGPDTNVQNSSDNLTSELQAAITGTVSVSGLTQGAVTYQQGFYDPDTGEFDLNIPVVAADAQTYKIDVQGNITNGVLTGSIAAEGYDAYGGKFTLAMNGAAIDTTGMFHNGGGENALNQTYTTPASATAAVGMSVSSLGLTPSGALMDMISPVHDVQVVVTMGSPQFQIPFPLVRYDASVGSLSGTTTFGDGATKIPVSLACNRQGQNWSCNVVGAVTVSFVAEPGALPIH